MNNLLPKLYSRDHKGKTREWSVKADKGNVLVEYGLLEGKKRTQKTLCVPKNVGKKNATTSQQQAEKEAWAKWHYQIKAKDYNVDVDLANLQMFPMLATDYRNYAKKVDWQQAIIQPKLDGLRLLIPWRYEADIGNYDKVEMISREGDTYVVDHLLGPAIERLKEINPTSPMSIHL